jgi:hypothetical protein
MKQLYALLAFGLLLTTPALAPALPKPLPAEKNDYCQDEAIRWVKSRFGEDTKILGSRIDKSGVQEKEVKGWRVLVSTDHCDGFFTMDYGVRATEECKTAVRRAGADADDGRRHGPLQAAAAPGGVPERPRLRRSLVTTRRVRARPAGSGRSR